MVGIFILKNTQPYTKLNSQKLSKVLSKFKLEVSQFLNYAKVAELFKLELSQFFH